MRAAISMVSEVAPAQAALPRPKMAGPMRKPVREPMRSASAPADSSSAANASVYPLTIHCAVDSAAEVGADRPKGDVHDRGVERDHEKAKADRGESERRAVRPDVVGLPGPGRDRLRRGKRVHGIDGAPRRRGSPRPLRSP